VPRPRDHRSGSARRCRRGRSRGLPTSTTTGMDAAIASNACSTCPRCAKAGRTRQHPNSRRTSSYGQNRTRLAIPKRSSASACKDAHPAHRRRERHAL
jgi:hypothetical protein